MCVSVCDAVAIRFRKREAIFWKYAGKQTETINFEQLSTRQSISVVTKVSLSFVFCSILQRQGPERSLQSLEDCLQHNNNVACRKLNTHTWQAQTLRTVKLSCKIYYRTVILECEHIYARTLLNQKHSSHVFLVTCDILNSLQQHKSSEVLPCFLLIHPTVNAQSVLPLIQTVTFVPT